MHHCREDLAHHSAAMHNSTYKVALLSCSRFSINHLFHLVRLASLVTINNIFHWCIDTTLFIILFGLGLCWKYFHMYYVQKCQLNSFSEWLTADFISAFSLRRLEYPDRLPTIPCKAQSYTGHSSRKWLMSAWTSVVFLLVGATIDTKCGS